MMVDAVDSEIGPADERRRGGGLTRAERSRLARTDALRADTVSPWEAGVLRAIPWLAWRAVFKGFQPVWLVASLLLALWFGAQWLGQTGGIRRIADSPPGEAARLAAEIGHAVPANADPAAFWLAELNAALDGDARHRPDLDRFRAWAAIGPDLIGPDALALSSLAGGGSPERLDARLRAGTPWEREAALSGEYQRLLRAGEARGLQPRELVFAPEAVQLRYDALRFRWAVSRSAADSFFAGDHRGQLELRSQPGLVAPGATRTRLYGGVRHLVIEACAASGSRLEGCTDPIIPAMPADPTAYALAALEAGLVELPLAGRTTRRGAEILQAALAAGRLSPALVDEFQARTADMLAPDRLSRAVAGTGLRADLAFAAPVRTERVLSGRLDLRTHPEAPALAELLRDVAAVRDATSPAEAIRLMARANSFSDMRQLAALARLTGPRTLAVTELLGGTALAEPPADIERPLADERVRRGTVLALASAALVLLLTLIRLVTPARMRRASRLNALDAWMSHSLLGRKV